MSISELNPNEKVIIESIEKTFNPLAWESNMDYVESFDFETNFPYRDKDEIADIIDYLNDVILFM